MDLANYIVAELREDACNLRNITLVAPLDEGQRFFEKSLVIHSKGEK